jgi:hypothetical protein
MFGIQEAKLLELAYRICEHYFMLGSSACPGSGGHGVLGGCELWIHRRLKCGLQDIVPLVLKHDLLVCRATVRGHTMLLVVGHAPNALNPDGTVRAW